HCHVPVHPGHVQPEHLDRGSTHRPHDVIQMRRDRVQRPPDAVIPQRRGSHPEHFRHRPRPRPILHPQQRRRRGQPVGHQHLDHLPVGHRRGRHLPHRTHRINNLPQPQPASELSHHRKCTKHLLHTRYAVPSPPPTHSRPCYTQPPPRSTRRATQPHRCAEHGASGSAPAPRRLTVVAGGGVLFAAPAMTVRRLS